MGMYVWVYVYMSVVLWVLEYFLVFYIVGFYVVIKNIDISINWVVDFLRGGGYLFFWNCYLWLFLIFELMIEI